jgi:ABC-type transport system involved in Fe-S cluster assembly fused permease/ATPase subunit
VLSLESTVPIAHYLSTIRNAGMILMLQDATVVEQRTHDELMASGGAYATLQTQPPEACATRLAEVRG